MDIVTIVTIAHIIGSGAYHWYREEATHEEGVASLGCQGAVPIPLHVIHPCNVAFISNHKWSRQQGVELICINLSCNVSLANAVVIVQSKGSRSSIRKHLIWATVNAAWRA